MLQLYYTAIFALVPFAGGQVTDNTNDVTPLPDEFVLDLYEKYKEAVEDGYEVGVVSRRYLRRQDRDFEIHVQRLKEVNGLKAHNLAIQENTENGPLIYIDNPLESKIAHAYLSLEEFKKQLVQRATEQRVTNVQEKQTAAHLDVSHSVLRTAKKDMRRKKVLGGGNAKVFGARHTESRHFEHTYMPGMKRMKKGHHDPYYYSAPRHLNSSSNWQMASRTTYPYKKGYSKSTTEKSTTTESVTKTTTDFPDTTEIFTTVKENMGRHNEQQVAPVADTTIDLDENTYQEKTTTSPAITETDFDFNIMTPKKREQNYKEHLEPKEVTSEHHHYKLDPAMLLSLRTANKSKLINKTVESSHKPPTRTNWSTTVVANTEKEVNSTEITANNNESNTEGDLTAADAVTEAETTISESTETTTVENDSTTITTVGDISTTTANVVTTKDQPVRPIWMRPKFKRITTKTTLKTTRRTLGRPLVFMDG